MDIRKLQRAIVDGLEDVKAQHISVFNTEHLSSMFERVIIASGTSNRQTKALAASVRDSVRKNGFPVLSTEGEDNGEWIIVDCGAAVAHIMQPAIREYYHLEEIWGGKSVRMKVGEASTRLVKASEPEPAPSARKRSAAKAPAEDAPAVKKPSKRAAKTEADKKMANKTAAYQRVASKGPAKRSASAKSAAGTAATAPGKAPAKAPARKSSTTVSKVVVNAPAKAPARKAPVAVKTVARRTPARKAPSRG